MLELNKLYNLDCMEGMKHFPDKYFELAIVDPPYGIGLDYTDRFGDTTDENRKSKGKYEIKKWNEKIPDENYFSELYRVSKNQIIWGCNFYNQYINTPGRIIWDKQNDNTERWSHCDLASYSGQRKNTIFRFTWDGFRQQIPENRIHPTQKPVALYKWLLEHYAKPGDKIIDTHVGSASSIIAFIDGGFDWIGFEIDKDYYETASKRIQNHVKQTDLFNEKKQNYIQTELI